MRPAGWLSSVGGWLAAGRASPAARGSVASGRRAVASLAAGAGHTHLTAPQAPTAGGRAEVLPAGPGADLRHIGRPTDRGLFARELAALLPADLPQREIAARLAAPGEWPAAAGPDPRAIGQPDTLALLAWADAPARASAPDQWRTARQEGLVDLRGDPALLDGSPVLRSPGALQASPSWDRPLSAAGHERLLRALEECCLHEVPMAYIVGVQFFWYWPFAVNRATLIPRPDSELFVEAAARLLVAPERLDAFRRCPARVLELGVGSGCLLLSTMLEAERAISGRRREALAGSHAAGPDTSHALGPAVLGTGVDLSAGALAVARRNAFRLGLGHRCTFLQSDWLARLGAGPAGSPPSPGYDLLLCNPPYIPPGDIATGRVQASVWRHEPASALFPNPLPGRAAPVPEAPAENDAHDDDGLDAVRRIAAARPGRWLAPPRRALPPAATLADIHRAGAGVLLLEIGEGQAATARDILLAADPSLAPVPGVGMLAGAGAFGGGAAMVAAAGPGIVIDYGHIPRLVALYRRRP